MDNLTNVQSMNEKFEQLLRFDLVSTALFTDLRLLKSKKHNTIVQCFFFASFNLQKA